MPEREHAATADAPRPGRDWIPREQGSPSGGDRADGSRERICYTKPSISDLEVAYAVDAARNGWGERCYEYIHRFEAEFARRLGVEHVVSTSSCTGALHMGLAALGVGPGDEVILAESNWIASAAPIVHLGATPVFVDILPDTWCIDPDAARDAVTPRTKAILAVHLYGNSCDMDRLQAIGAEHGVAIVEDAAEAIGSAWRGRPAGSMGAFGTFSFHGTKTITTGEGGALITNDPQLYERVLTLSNHGRARGQRRQFWPETVGFKYKMSNIQAAIGCGQLERLDELVSAKRRVFHAYRQGLAGLPVSMNPEPPGTVNGFWMPTIVCDRDTGVTREDLRAAFERRAIDARVFFHPLSSLPMFEDVPRNVHARDIPTRAINLPSYAEMGDEQLEAVLDVVRGLLS